MTDRFGRTELRVLTAIAVWNIAAFVYLLWFTAVNGYLPPPYFHVPDDTFMDYFNTTFWAWNDGRYTEWRSIYPPFAFLLGQLVSSEECYYTNFIVKHDARDACSDYGLYIMLAIGLIGVFQNARLFSRDRREQLLCFLAMSLSFPFLFAVERANYLVFAYPILVLAFSTKNKALANFFLACTINLKQYLLVLLAYPVLVRDWRALFWCAFFSATVTAAAVLYLAEPNYLMFIQNMFDFIEPEVTGNIFRVPYAFSVDQFIKFESTNQGTYFLQVLYYLYPIVTIELFEQLSVFLQVIVPTLVAVVGIRLFQLRGTLQREHFAYATLICLFNLSEASSVHSAILLLPFLPYVFRALSRIEIFALFVLFQSFDIRLIELWPYHMESYITGEYVYQPFSILAGTHFRPTAMLTLLVFLALRLVRLKRKALDPHAEDRVKLSPHTS